ncbi:aminofutalosine synthase MqnE [Candidatus Poribacteria bacterium]|nr:aminofutalosine synthase MqnE [Candidatus Poribacteria bacterium]
MENYNLFTDPKLPTIYEKVKAKKRLSFEEGITLYESPDITGVGFIANQSREHLNGNVVYYNINQHIDYSNVCILHARCHFCAFARKNMQTEGAWEMSVDEFLDKAMYSIEHGCTEIHSVGGLHPKLPFDYYLQIIRGLKERMPDVHLKFFTAVEVHHFSRIFKMSIEDVLKQLREAGLDSLPGGGAEIFAEETREKICPGKLSAEGWLEIHDIAHRLGIPTNATMLYGHLETNEDRVDHLIRLREQQDKSGGFVTFIPLAFHPANTRLAYLPSTSGLTDLRNIAVSRLMLDNMPHIKVYWIMTGLKTAQIALSFGADDIDGTVTEEKITHMAGADTPEAVSVDALTRLIEEAGYIPVERDTLYNEIIREGNQWYRKVAHLNMGLQAAP